MTIILFLIDTSASMCQRAYVNGVQKSYLDIAKGAVETFLKFRQRSQDCMGDRYMLLTFEDPPANVKAGWKENHATFMNELKNLQSTGLTSMGEALKNAFDLLNLNRMQSGIDTYGQGRCPFYLEPSVIIVITDGGRYSFRNGIHQEIILPLHAQIPGTKLTKEPFRWDQRLFSLVLRMAGNKVDERVDGKVPHDDSPIEKMCEVTGGRSYRVKSHYVLNQCIESLVQKVQPGVVVQFEPMLVKELKDPDVQQQDIVFQPTKKMIYVQKHPSQKQFPVGFWPIPEPYWPDPKANNLPPRDAHPKIRILTPYVDEPAMVRNFPVDKYDVEACPLTLQILSKREPTKCWPVVVANGMHGLEMPFGYLKANGTYTQVHLVVLPYNYPVLLPLLNDLFQKYALSPPSDWMYKFSNYIRAIPQYYGPFLRRALMSANVQYQLLQYILPENLDNYLSPAVANYLKTMKNTAKQDQETLCLRVFKQLKVQKPPYHQIEMVKLNSGLPLKRDLVTHPQLKEIFGKLHTEIVPIENYNIIVPSVIQQNSTKNYRNPFDVPRRDLIDEMARMRENFLKIPTSGINIFSKDAGHSLPISEMGNYQEYLKNKETPLREIEPTNVRQHMFGNPYKKDKHMVMVDEADLGDVAPMKPNGNAQHSQQPMIATKKFEPNRPNRKRKAGPIRKDYVFRRLSIDSDGSSSTSGTGHSISTNSNLDLNSESSIPSTIDVDQSSIESFDAIGSSSPTRSVGTDSGSELDLIIDFEFNDSAVDEEFNVNGPVQNFINGDIEDMEETIMPPITLNQMSVLTVTPAPPLSFTGRIPPINGPMIGQISTSPCMPLPPPPTVFSSGSNLSPIISHSDMNDVLEISKILQQCHSNGSNFDKLESSIEPPSLSSDGIPENGHTDTIVKDDVKHNGPAAATDINNFNHSDTLAAMTTVMDDDTQLNGEQKETIRQRNLEARSIIFRDIRRPGRNYSGLLDHLNLINGSLETKYDFIQMCIEESLRFRRRKMAECIQEWWDKQIDRLGTGG